MHALSSIPSCGHSYIQLETSILSMIIAPLASLRASAGTTELAARLLQQRTGSMAAVPCPPAAHLISPRCCRGQGMVSMYVASHYKNTPNDLILMSDAPAHHLFVLLAPVDETQVRCIRQHSASACRSHLSHAWWLVGPTAAAGNTPAHLTGMPCMQPHHRCDRSLPHLRLPPAVCYLCATSLPAPACNLLHNLPA
jgi:hypothetical protein